MTHCVWDDLLGQPKAVTFLRNAAREGVVGHAYLFVGPPGSGRKTAARALACALLCDDGGCGGCRTCRRVREGTHPDVRVLEPQGASGYLVEEQIRPLIADAHLKPVEGARKVYVLDRAETLNASSANAFLKTLEEPPDDVVVVLLAADFESVLPTVASRCQVVRFKGIAPSEGVAMLVEATGADEATARGVLAAAGGIPSRARDFLRSPSRLEARTAALSVLAGLSLMDEQDVLLAAKRLLAAVRAPLEELKAEQASELAERAEFLGKGVSARPLEDRHKRELTAREREGLAEILNVAESWLRDCVALGLREPGLVSNADAVDAMEPMAAVLTPESGARAVRTVEQARRRLSYNVSPQLAVEAMLFDIQEVLRCPR